MFFKIWYWCCDIWLTRYTARQLNRDSLIRFDIGSQIFNMISYLWIKDFDIQNISCAFKFDIHATIFALWLARYAARPASVPRNHPHRRAKRYAMRNHQKTSEIIISILIITFSSQTASQSPPQTCLALCNEKSSLSSPSPCSWNSSWSSFPVSGDNWIASGLHQFRSGRLASAIFQMISVLCHLCLYLYLYLYVCLYSTL